MKESYVVYATLNKIKKIQQQNIKRILQQRIEEMISIASNAIDDYTPGE